MQKRDDFTYRQAEEYILELPKFTNKNKSEHTRQLLELLGHPEQRLSVVHVAGTNGKGSVCAFLSSILSTAGNRTGMFTSPHLLEIRERFCINGTPVTEKTFTEVFEEVLEAVNKITADGYPHPTFFEMLCVMAFVLFDKENIDYVLLETGLGGRLDATNVIERPMAVILTSIGYDHMEYLGTTIREITYEKAGIIKDEVPVIYEGGNAEAEQVIKQQAKERKAPCYPLYPQMYEIFINQNNTVAFSLKSRYSDYDKLCLPGMGSYQAQNASLALLALEMIDVKQPVTMDAIRKGICETVWPGRMEQVLPGVMIDGAHNEPGIYAFLRSVKHIHGKRKYLLFSMVDSKNYQKAAEILGTESLFDKIMITEIDSDRKVAAEVLKEAVQTRVKCPVEAEKDIRKAYADVRSWQTEGDLLFAAGSLYLAGEIKRIIKEETHD